MKKLFLGIVTAMLLLGMMLPLSVNAATLTLEKGKTEMKVKDTVEVTVTLDNPAEEFQFDLKFDNKKYQYINGSAKSELDSTHSNLIANDVVRVSAFDLNGKTTKTATLKFKAINTGTNVPFSIVGNVAEVDGVQENFVGTPIVVKKIGGDENSQNGGGAGAPQYVDQSGQPIAVLPQTGENARANGNASVAGSYKKLITGETVVPYAFRNAVLDPVLTVAEVKAEFGSTITGLTNDPVQTGDAFVDKNGTQNTIIIYGDVNGDGKVTTFDALTIIKAEKGDVALDNYKSEAADVKNNAVIDKDDAYAVQNFVLGLRTTNTDTIIDSYPTEAAEISVQQVGGTVYRYTKTSLATITSSNDVKITLDQLGYTVDQVPAGVDKKSVSVTFEEVSDGVFSMKLYATVAGGEYKITPVIKGNKIPNGQISGTQVNATPQEVYTITDISLSGNGVVADGSITLRAGKSINPSITFMHTYKNEAGAVIGQVAIPDEKLTANNIKLSLTNDANALDSSKTKLKNKDGQTVEVDASGNVIAGNNSRIISIIIDAIAAGNAKIKLTAINDSAYNSVPGYVSNYEKEVNVTVLEKARTQNVLVNGQAVTNINLPLYGYVPDGASDVVEYDGKFYTMIPMTLIDEDGEISKMISSQVGKKSITNEVAGSGDIIVKEGASATGRDISVLGFYLTDNPDANSGISRVYTTDNPMSSTQELDAIGIAMGSATESIKTKLETQGLTLRFDGIENNQIVRKEITITVSATLTKPVTRTVAEADKLNVPVAQENVKTEANKEVATVKKVDITAPVVKDNELDYTNAKLTVTMSDGKTKTVALIKDMVVLSEYDENSEEPQEVTGTVTYEGNKYTFTVTLNGKVETPVDNTNTTVEPDVSEDLDNNNNEQNNVTDNNETSDESTDLSNTASEAVASDEATSENNI